MVNIWFGTRTRLEKSVNKGNFSEGWTVICFYGKDENPIDLSRHKGEYICTYLEDVCAVGRSNENISKFFPDADRIADMVIRSVAEGKGLYFQEDTRGLSCAAAVVEFFNGGGMQVFNRVRYHKGTFYLDVKIYEKLYGALCCMKLLHDDIDFDKLRTGRAVFDKQEMISKIYDIYADECASLSLDGNDAGKCHGAFAFVSVTKDKVFHYYAAGLFPDEFLNKYSKEDIEFFGVEFGGIYNNYGIAYMDSECGESFTSAHLLFYNGIIEEKFGIKEKVVYD